ncbi:hypothetical protein HPB51_002468 [Rhipicephalus microplus]|uniref:Uncharacterized protein n=1 Tax=Rhipicephalus microplus TaxID=6941 RepID=A0A9J6DEG4_RHIMP|nr:hypothetical protein HPB51_002468 [Rhipicephalus microplus]
MNATGEGMTASTATLNSDMDEESLNAFLALRNNTKVKLAVELDVGELLESQLNAEAEQVAVATLFWMHKHGLERLALFVRSPGYSKTHMQRLVSLTKERSDLLPPHATDAVETKRFCVSVSMAVHRFLVNEHNPSVVNSTCFGESLVPYEQVPNFSLSICLEGESTATYDAESMAVVKHDNNYAFTFENEESLHLKAQRIVDLLGAEACVAAFHVEYDGGRNACVALNHSSSRLTELASALHGFLICILSEKPPSPIQLPQRACSLTVYQHVFYDRTTDRVMPRDASSFRDFVELSKRDVTSRLVGAFDDVGFRVPWAKDHLFPGRFARSVASWCHDYALHGVAFLALNFSALQRAEPSIRALNNMSTVRQLIVLGIPRTDDPLILNRFAPNSIPKHNPNADVISRMRNGVDAVSSGRQNDWENSPRQTAQLTNQLVRIHRHLAGVCVAANMAVLKFSLPPRHSDLDDSCIDEEQINYAQVCTWEGNVEYDTVSSAVLSRKHDNVLTYENEYSLETKANGIARYQQRLAHRTEAYWFASLRQRSAPLSTSRSPSATSSWTAKWSTSTTTSSKPVATELSNEFSERDPKPVLILLISSFEPESRLKELSMYPDLLALTNEVPNESKDCKLHGTMTATTDEALKLSMSRLLELSDSLGSRGGVCFSTTLAVYRYRLHLGLHGAGESCRRMIETTFGEACPPEESDRLVEVSSMTSYTYNKSHMLAFEDQRSLRIKASGYSANKAQIYKLKSPIRF